MSETEELYTIPEPTLQEQKQALEREVQHVTEQLRVEHTQVAHWKARAVAAEKALESILRGVGRTPGKIGLPTKGHTSDSVHGQPDALDELL